MKTIPAKMWFDRRETGLLQPPNHRRNVLGNSEVKPWWPGQHPTGFFAVPCGTQNEETKKNKTKDETNMSNSLIIAHII
jgi:hypothetical protein